MKTHIVKSWAHFYDAILRGWKTHDLRKDDRDYQVGDSLQLERYDNINGRYTGEHLQARITYITNKQMPCAFSSSVLPADYCILSLKVITA
jgi:hypothetical protein